MAKLLTGTRIYGTGTVDTQLFVSGTNSATSTTTGALQVVGGVGIGGNLYVGGTIFGGTITGTASTATNADNVKTVLSTSTSVFFPVFVDSNNATAGYEAVYSSSTFTIIPSSGNVGIGVATPTEKLHVAGNYILLKNTADTAAGAVLDSGSTLGQNTQILLRDRGSDKWAVRKNSANNFDIYGSAAGAAALTIFSSTNFVGIGATVIEDALHVRRDSATTSTGIIIQNRSASGLPEAGIKFITGPLDLADTRYAEISSTGTTSPGLIFKTGGGTAPTERMRITAQGGVAFGGATNYGISGQILQSNGNAAPTWISTGSLAAANATTATHLSGGTAGQVPYQTAPGVTSFYGPGTAGNVLVSNGTSVPSYNNTLTLTGTTAATSTTTGALQVVGGFGLGGDAYFGGNIVQVGGTHATLATTYNLINTTATTVNFAGAATTLTMGASGSGTTNVRNNLTVSGNLTVQGTTTIVDSTVTNIADPILTLGGGTGNSAPTADDNKDRGVAFKYVNNAGTTSTGFFGYDDSTGYLTYIPTATITNEVVSGTKGAMDVNLAGGSAMAIVYQSSQDNTAFLAAGSSGFILQTNGTGSPPTWVSAGGVSAGSATNADNIRTISQAGNAVYYPTFVDSNNATNAYESVYTTSSFTINPATGAVSIVGLTTSTANKLQIGQTSVPATTFTNTTHLRIVGTANTATDEVFITLVRDRNPGIQFSGGAAISLGSYITPTGASAPASRLTFSLKSATDNSDVVNVPVMSLLDTGNVGIGDTLPGTKLTVLGAGGSTLGTNGYLVHVGGTDSSVDPVRYMIGFSHGNTSTSTNVRAAIGSMITTGGAGNLIFETGTTGAGQVERMRITGLGGVSFGTGGANYGSSGQILQSNGNAAPTWVTAISGSSAQVNTVLQTSNATYYPAFVDSNNASATAESLYTTSSFTINALSGRVGIGGAVSTAKLHVQGTGAVPSPNATTNSNGLLRLRTADAVYVDIGAYGVSPWTTWMQSGDTGSAAYYAMAINPLGGNVGIGTTSTSYKLDVAGSGRFTPAAVNDQGFFVTSAAGAVNHYFDVQLAPGGGAYSYLRFQVAGNNIFTWGSSLSAYANDLALNSPSGAITLSANGSERLRITSSGGIAFGGAANYGTSGQILQSNGDAAPTWIALSSRTVGTSTQVNTVLQTASASYFPTFVDSNNATATAESLYTTSSFVINPATGNVGFNKASPTESLYIERAGTQNLIFLNQSTSASAWVGMSIGFLGTEYFAAKGNVNTGEFQLGGKNASGYYTTIYSNNAETVRVTGGNVGIGTTAPNDKLQVQTSSATAYDATNDQGQYGSGAGITVTNLDETSQSFAQINLQVSGNAGRAVGRIVAIRTASATSDLAFVTENANTKAEKMRIFSNGNVSIGTTSTTNKFEVAGTAGQLFSVSDSFTGTIFSVNDISGIPSIEVLDTGLVKMAQYNGQLAIGTGTVASSTVTVSIYGMLQTMGTLGEIRASSEITAYYSSDSRLKENIKLIENPITIIDQIRGVTFDWTDEHMARRGGEDGYFVRKHDIGVIAQEVQAVLPELVGTREDGYLAVKYEKMVPLLIEAIKSQQKTIDSLVKDLADVKEFINQLKNNK